MFLDVRVAALPAVVVPHSLVDHPELSDASAFARNTTASFFFRISYI